MDTPFGVSIVPPYTTNMFTNEIMIEGDTTFSKLCVQHLQTSVTKINLGKFCFGRSVI